VKYSNRAFTDEMLYNYWQKMFMHRSIYNASIMETLKGQNFRKVTPESILGSIFHSGLHSNRTSNNAIARVWRYSSNWKLLFVYNCHPVKISAVLYKLL